MLELYVAELGTLRTGPLPPLLARYVFSWETMHTIMGGQSAIDLSHLRLSHAGEAEAARFLARYGYDLQNPVQFQDLERIRTEALGFIRGVLLPGLPVEMPGEFDTMPILDVLRLAAGQSGDGAGAAEFVDHLVDSRDCARHHSRRCGGDHDRTVTA